MKTGDKPLKDAINEMLKTYHLDQKMSELTLVQSWEKVLGKTVANRTTELTIRHKKLFVSLNSASLRQDLVNEREKIIKLLNDEAGSEVIDEIIFR